LEAMWTEYGGQLLGPYGFKDAFNPSFTFEPGCENGWFDTDYLGIDQGPIVLMIENYRSGFIWNLMKKNPYIVAGLQRAGFSGGWLDEIKTPRAGALSAKAANPDVPLEPAGFFRREVFRSSTGQKLPYQMLEPAGTGRSFIRAKGSSIPPRYPLVVFLHGSGENGIDNAAQMRNGVYAFCEKENREKYPCYLLAPQCPPGKRWSGATRDQSSLFSTEPTEPAQAVLELIDNTVKNNPGIDPNRVYITGMSMGGSGTIDLMMRRPDLFAAGLPVCGRGDAAHAKKIKNIPVWIWHGGLDETNPVVYSRRMVDALKKAGGKVKYTELSTFGHDIWFVAYYNPAVMEWLFAQRKK
ncbi:MAG TPA: glucoamylase family protein, partial [Saprospiraceae bacterium]|nr:glucoamylase family protein [Saprospiraceae bacterium]